MSGCYSPYGPMNWRPISEMTEKPDYETSVLLWCPGMIVSGPGIVCHWADNAWIMSCTDTCQPLPKNIKITHYALLTDPTWERNDEQVEGA